MNRYAESDEARDLSVVKREICVACGKSAIPVEDSDQGPICRHCKDSATEVRTSWVIGGRTFVKNLKKPFAIVPKKSKAGTVNAGQKER